MKNAKIPDAKALMRDVADRIDSSASSKSLGDLNKSS